MRLRKISFLVIVLALLPFYTSKAQVVVGPLMTSTWKSFEWPLNAAFPEAGYDVYGVVNGHMGNSCGPTAIAKLLHYHRHPVHGRGSHQFTDEYGLSYSANFEGTYYEWALMKDQFSDDATHEEYWPTAILMLHSFIMMEDPYNTGRSIEDICRLLKKYMRYAPSAYVAYRFDYSREDYIQLLKDELDAGRPLLIESWTSDSNPPGSGGSHAGHYWNIDGYDAQNHFHISYNNGDFDAWLDIDSIQVPSLEIDAHFIWALIDAKPDSSEKTFSLTMPEDNRMLKMGEPANLTWTCQNIPTVHLDFSYNGIDWIQIGENIPTEPLNWVWDGPTEASRDASLRVRDAANANYEYYYNGFQTYEKEQITLHSPLGPDTFEAGTDLCIAWESDGIQIVKLEYKESQSSDWTMINENLPGQQFFTIWEMPSTVGRTYQLRLSNPDGSIISQTDGIQISGDPQTGGPHKRDSHTVLLMHFDQNLVEEVTQPAVVTKGSAPAYAFSAPGKGAALYLDNAVRGNNSYIQVSNFDALNMRGSFTVDFWLKVNSWDASHNTRPAILVKPSSSTQANYSLTGNGVSGTITFSVRTSFGNCSVESSPERIQPGRWYHVAMIHEVETRQLTLLVHNQQKERIDEQTTNYQENATLTIGNYNLSIGQNVPGYSYFNGCIDELRISRIAREFDSEWSGIPDKKTQLKELVFYPNPASDNITVGPLKPGFIPSRIQFINLSGQIIDYTLPQATKNQNNHLIINTAQLPTGLYWVLLSNETEQVGGKLLIYR
ncbi:MAG: C10 family peptidase [Bacteroidales bacterium]|jgi:hypothetical protein